MVEYPPFSANGFRLARARDTDVPAIQAMVTAAYSKYVERIGKPPAPMTADYGQPITKQDVFVLIDASSEDTIGSIVLSQNDESNCIKINNLVVDPATQGRGCGRILLDYAEKAARAQGREALVLFTNIKMYENLGFYAKFGFEETERKVDEGFERVYFRKNMS